MPDSLIGGSFDLLTPEGQAIVSRVMGDTVGGNVTTTQVGGGTLVVGTGSGNVAQGVFISPSTGTVVAGEINMGGGMNLTVALPPEVSLVFEGPSGPVTSAQVQTYMSNLIHQIFPDPTSDAAQNLNTAVQSVLGALGGLGDQSISLRIVALTWTDTTGTRANEEIVFNGGSNVGNELLVFALAQVSDRVLTLQNVKSALLASNGTVKVADTFSGVAISGDVGDQNVTGSKGRDTLVGGGGNDTLTGGLGADVFGTSVLGHLIITDFNTVQDKLAFTLPSVTNMNQLAGLFTGLTVENGNSVLHFGTSSITLVGVDPAALTLDLIKFNLD